MFISLCHHPFQVLALLQWLMGLEGHWPCCVMDDVWSCDSDRAEKWAVGCEGNYSPSLAADTFHYGAVWWRGDPHLWLWAVGGWEGACSQVCNEMMKKREKNVRKSSWHDASVIFWLNASYTSVYSLWRSLFSCCLCASVGGWFDFLLNNHCVWVQFTAWFKPLTSRNALFIKRLWNVCLLNKFWRTMSCADGIGKSEVQVAVIGVGDEPLASQSIT